MLFFFLLQTPSNCEMILARRDRQTNSRIDLSRTMTASCSLFIRNLIRIIKVQLIEFLGLPVNHNYCTIYNASKHIWNTSWIKSLRVSASSWLLWPARPPWRQHGSGAQYLFVKWKDAKPQEKQQVICHFFSLFRISPFYLLLFKNVGQWFLGWFPLPANGSSWAWYVTCVYLYIARV